MANTVVFLVLLLIPAAYAVTYTVGGGSGWASGVNYDTWASGQTFVVNDTLVFNYGRTHAVDEVTQSDYQSCSSSNSISSSSNSPTTITLSSPGTRYFICPRSNHCSQRVRLTVTVIAANVTATPTPTGTPVNTTAPTPTGTNTTAPTPTDTPANTTVSTPNVTPSSDASSILGL